jgi:uncharacterized protein
LQKNQYHNTVQDDIPQTPSRTTLEQRVGLLHHIVREMGAVAVAFSGGCDSTLLLAVCCEVLGPERVLAITANSPTLPAQEMAEARALTTQLGVRHEVVAINELDNPDFARNDAQRCFFCHNERLREIAHRAQSCGFATLVWGVNTDDDPAERPGIQVAWQHGVRLPLREAGLSKSDIRQISQQRSLPTHDKPAMACLASRIPYGRAITADLLEQIEEAEAFLKQEIGLRQVRVRHHDTIARLEVEPDDIPRLARPDVREQVVARLQHIGFRYVALDLAGFRSGSLHEAR